MKNFLNVLRLGFSTNWVNRISFNEKPKPKVSEVKKRIYYDRFYQHWKMNKLYDQFDKDVIRAVKLQTEAMSVMKLMYNHITVDKSVCDTLIEPLTNDELQSLGLDVDSEIRNLLAVHKQYVMSLEKLDK